jgi:hypothetical protein
MITTKMVTTDPMAMAHTIIATTTDTMTTATMVTVTTDTMTTAIMVTMTTTTATTMIMTMVDAATTATDSTHGGHLLSLTPHLLREYTVVTFTSPPSLVYYHLHQKFAVTTYLASVFTWANGINLELLVFI